MIYVVFQAFSKLNHLTSRMIMTSSECAQFNVSSCQPQNSFSNTNALQLQATQPACSSKCAEVMVGLEVRQSIKYPFLIPHHFLFTFLRGTSPCRLSTILVQLLPLIGMYSFFNDSRTLHIPSDMHFIYHVFDDLPPKRWMSFLRTFLVYLLNPYLLLVSH